MIRIEFESGEKVEIISGGLAITSGPSEDGVASFTGLDTRGFNYVFDQVASDWNRMRAAAAQNQAAADILEAVPAFVTNGVGVNRFLSAETEAVAGDTLARIGPYVFDQVDSDWQKMRQGNGNGATIPTGCLANTPHLWQSANVFTGMRAASALGDADAGNHWPGATPFLFNGTAFDRARNNAAANISATTQPFQLGVAEPGEWALESNPGANTQATATRAAGAAGVRHVCRSISISLTNDSGAAIGPITVVLRDGATGAGTVLRTWLISLPATESKNIDLAGLNIVGSAATAMTLEFTAAAGATTSEAVGLSGYSTV